MMKLFEKRAGKKTRGQTMVEFALILPVLLMTMYGVMEFGRLLFIYVTTTSATREAARYAAAVGLNEAGTVERYRDCDGIREAAMRVGILAGINPGDVDIRYDSGPNDPIYDGDPANQEIEAYWIQLPQCPGPVALGDRVRVKVTGHFEPIVPLVPIPNDRFRDITSDTSRTIIRDVRVSENFIAPQIVSTQPPSPYVTFSSSQTDVLEDIGNIPVTVQTDIPVPPGYGDVTVEVGIIDVLEALGGGIDYQIYSPLTLVFEEGDPNNYKTIDIAINDDRLYETTERIILYIRSVSNNNLGYPRLHVIRIEDNDSDQVPTAYFFPSNGVTINENDPLYPQLIIPVILDRPSGVAASVDFTVSSLTNGPNFGYTPLTGRLNFPVDYSSTDRTVTSTSAIIITPIDDFISTGDREILITLSNPVNAVLDTTNTLPYMLPVTIFDDENICNLTASGIQSSGTDFWVDISTSGNEANLSGMNVDFTADVYLTSVAMDEVQIWSGTAPSPVGLASGDWIEGRDRNISTGATERILLQFTDSTNTINSWSLDFGSCGGLSVGPTPYPPTP